MAYIKTCKDIIKNILFSLFTYFIIIIYFMYLYIRLFTFMAASPVCLDITGLLFAFIATWKK